MRLEAKKNPTDPEKLFKRERHFRGKQEVAESRAGVQQSHTRVYGFAGVVLNPIHTLICSL